jgi:hypothetical protein
VKPSTVFERHSPPGTGAAVEQADLVRADAALDQEAGEREAGHAGTEDGDLHEGRGRVSGSAGNDTTRAQRSRTSSRRGIVERAMAERACVSQRRASVT